MWPSTDVLSDPRYGSVDLRLELWSLSVCLFGSVGRCSIRNRLLL